MTHPNESSAPSAEVRKASENALRSGRELMTPKAVAELLGITDTAVRTARLHGRVESPFALRLTQKTVHLVRVDSAIAYWVGSDSGPVDEHLGAMRRNGTVMALGGEFWNVLSDHPVDSPTSQGLGPRIGSRFPQATARRSR